MSHVVFFFFPLSLPHGGWEVVGNAKQTTGRWPGSGSALAWARWSRAGGVVVLGRTTTPWQLPRPGLCQGKGGSASEYPRQQNPLTDVSV